MKLIRLQKQILTFLFLISTFYNGHSQLLPFQKPNYDAIKKDIQDSLSVYYYPKLMSKLVAYDTNLTNEDYRHLYYGYIYQKEYMPYRRSDDEEELLKFYQSTKIRETDYDSIIKLATHSISQFPFDLRPMNFMAYIYYLKGDEEMAKKVAYRFQGSFEAILSSGDGKTCETGYHVISISHEYVFLNMFQFKMASQELTIDHCDYLTLEKDLRNINGIYFNVQKLFEINLENLKKK
jgi:hypothetical protein